jgi:hypothetical protein
MALVRISNHDLSKKNVVVVRNYEDLLVKSIILKLTLILNLKFT